MYGLVQNSFGRHALIGVIERTSLRVVLSELALLLESIDYSGVFSGQLIAFRYDPRAKKFFRLLSNLTFFCLS